MQGDLQLETVGSSFRSLAVHIVAEGQHNFQHFDERGASLDVMNCVAEDLAECWQQRNSCSLDTSTLSDRSCNLALNSRIKTKHCHASLLVACNIAI